MSEGAPICPSVPDPSAEKPLIFLRSGRIGRIGQIFESSWNILSLHVDMEME
jgi:hypothetical protein